MTNIFGWDYPPGCSGTPFDEEHPDNSMLAEAFPNCAGPYELYRQAYKYTNCGPTVGLTFSYYRNPTDAEIADGCSGGILETKTLYCDDLRTLGTWQEMDKRGQLATELLVSSIVEGIDACTDTESVEFAWDDDPEEVSARFDAAVDSVDTQAAELWNETHGCETCAKHFQINLDNELSPVWDECPSCGGHGDVI